MPTEVTCRDPETGDEETKIIENDWLLITDGDYYMDAVNVYGNGTVQITIKRN